MTDVWMKLTTGLGILAIITLVYFIILGANLQSRQIEACKNLGGMPITERGIYKLCGKPENFMKIEVK